MFASAVPLSTHLVDILLLVFFEICDRAIHGYSYQGIILETCTAFTNVTMLLSRSCHENGTVALQLRAQNMVGFVAVVSGSVSGCREFPGPRQLKPTCRVPISSRTTSQSAIRPSDLRTRTPQFAVDGSTPTIAYSTRARRYDQYLLWQVKIDQQEQENRASTRKAESQAHWKFRGISGCRKGPLPDSSPR